MAVPPDGSAFNDAIEIDEATGIVDLPSNPKFAGVTNCDNWVDQDHLNRHHHATILAS